MLAVIPKNASPRTDLKRMAELAIEGVEQAEKVEPLDYRKFAKAEKRAKAKYVDFGGGSGCFSIDLIKKAMRVLGTKKMAEAYWRKEKPVVVKHKHTGHSVVIAPADKSQAQNVVSFNAVKTM